MSPTQDEIDAVLSNLAEVSRAELASSGIGECDARAFLGNVKVSAIRRGGEPVMLYGFEHVDGETISTWTLATARFYESPLRAAREVRSHLGKARRLKPRSRFVAHVRSPHPKAGQWVEMMGFKFLGSNAGARVYFLPPLA